jgi:hypothetical protein
VLERWPKLTSTGGAAAALALGVGVAVGVAARPASTPNTITHILSGQTVTRILTRTRTVERVPTQANSGAVARPAESNAGTPGPRQSRPVNLAQSGGPSGTQRFAGTGNKLLGTITVSQPNATLHWTNSAGRFRLLFDGGAVAVDSTASSGRTGTLPLTYSQVKVITPGRWSLRIG